MQSRQVETAAQRLARLTPKEPEERTHLPPFTGGVQGNKTASQIDVSESPVMLNLMSIGDELLVDTGYAPFGGVVPPGLVPQAAFQAFAPAAPGAVEAVTTILVCTTALLSLQGGAWLPMWSGWTTSMTYGPGTVTFNLVYTGTPPNSTQFPTMAGSVASLPLSDGTFFHTTVASFNPGTGVLVTTTAVSGTVPDGSQVYMSILLHGDVTLQVTGVPFPPLDWFLFTNQVDPPIFVSAEGQGGVLVTDLVVDPGAVPVTMTCRALAVFHECVLYLGTTETIQGGQAQPMPRRVRMSDAGDPRVVRTIAEGAVTGIAAIYDLLDTDDDIHCAYVLGPWLILYRAFSIMRATYLGVLNQTLFWEYMITGEGSQSTGAVAPIAVPRAPTQTHVFLGQGNVYTYTGGYALTPVGDPVYLAYLAQGGVLDPARKNNSVVIWSSNSEEVWVLFTQRGDALPQTMLRLNLNGNKPGWFVRRFTDAIVSVNEYLTGHEDDTIARLLLVSPSAREVFLYDYATLGDNGVPVTWMVQSKDVGDGDKLWRFDRVVVRGRGTATVSVSLDGGVSFSTLGEVVMGATTSRRQVTIDAPVQSVADYCRLQFSGNDPTFALHWSQLWHEFESEW